ncbi:MAG: AI-2E family transporter [Prevotellaceae bacterium]|jgi:predicted PurR-regulated permease PerM|nr:AI-2E family transporter [Prevotellaceae bacterium]
MSFQDSYRRKVLTSVILLIGVAIFYTALPYLGGLLGACTAYILLRSQMRILTERRNWRKGLAASLLIIETCFLFLIPLISVVYILSEGVQYLSQNPNMLLEPAQRFVDFVREHTNYDMLDTKNLSFLISLAPRVGQYIVSGVSSLGINIVVMLFILYFMLLSGKRMETYISDLLPFRPEYKKEFMHEIRMIVTSNAVGIPLLAIIQGLVALIGYYIFHAPQSLMLSVLTAFATVIPALGTTLVWVPLAGYMLLGGDWIDGIGILAYGVIVITQIDNLVRFLLQKKMADIHPIITIFGVFIGLSLFGFMGIIFGPLLLSLFIFCFEVYRKEYLA